ncbi:MAG: hypothetical protein HYY84_05740 [Deltaproteobacteria bacterium]|nr:hypothetical protein [Deltaproteobacteria bacterium]
MTTRIAAGMKPFTKALWVAMALIALTACSEDKGPRLCVAQSECGADSVCLSGSCQAPPCPQGGCPLGGFCSTAGVCVGRPVCTVQADCGDGKVCVNGGCVPTSGSCIVDTDCTGANETCSGGRCQAASCDTVPCTGGKVCDPTTKRCVDCNSSDRRCANGATCVAGTCEAVPLCDAQGNCAEAWQACESGACVARTCGGGAGNCPSGSFCTGGRCSPRVGCATQADCAADPGSTCDATTGLCLKSALGICAPCVADAECNAQSGGANKCTASTSGKFCTTDCASQSCPDGFSCFAANHQCLPLARTCANNCALSPTACLTPQVCLTALGTCGSKLGICGACGKDAECQGGKCLRTNAAGTEIAMAYCSRACTGSGQGNCPSGFACQSGNCVVDGSSCNANRCDGVSCPQGKLCNPGSGQCVDCVADLQCQSGARCNLTTNTCEMAACTSDQNCTNGFVCKLTATPKVCVQCVSDANCAGTGRTTKCHQATNTCVVPDVCGGCPLGQVCNTNTLRCQNQGGGGGGADGGASIGCSSPMDCINNAPNIYCDPQTGVCSSSPGGGLGGGCTTNADCNAGQTCQSLGGLINVCTCDQMQCLSGNANACCPNGATCLLTYCLPI